MEMPGDQVSALAALEDELDLEVTQRRVLAAKLFELGWQQTQHLAEHLAWLLERETDALTAYSLYCAVLVTHPERWTLTSWTRSMLQVTPFGPLRTAMLETLVAENALDFDNDDDRALLDMADPAHRAILLANRWLTDSSDKGGIGAVLSMMQPQASVPEKVSAMRIVRFSDDPQIDEHAVAALAALFRVERHPCLSLKIADVLVSKRRSRIDLDLIAYLIRTRHEGDIPAAEIAMKRVFYEAEGFLMDSFEPTEQRPSGLSTALLSMFSPTQTPDNGQDIAKALDVLSIDVTQPLAAFAATAALEAAHQPNSVGTKLVFVSAQSSVDPIAKALAIRVLGQKSEALFLLLDHLKALAVAPDTDPRVRRSAFHALVNTRQSGLPARIEDIIDLYFRYLREAPFSHFADAVHGSDVAEAPQHFLARFAESFDAIKTQAARQAALRLVERPFGFGIRDEFAPYWPQVIQLMLRTLDEPQHDELHYMIFWNMLHEVPIPELPASTLAQGLQERLARTTYAERIRAMIADWLHANRRG
jgi:truncated hemoglobin YjbI